MNNNILCGYLDGQLLNHGGPRLQEDIERYLPASLWYNIMLFSRQAESAEHQIRPLILFYQPNLHWEEVQDLELGDGPVVSHSGPLTVLPGNAWAHCTMYSQQLSSLENGKK